MIRYLEKSPPLIEYKHLRDMVGWNLTGKGITDERIQQSLNTSPYSVCAYYDDVIIGMVRLSGDLAMYGYIQDTIVLPSYQGRGVGRILVQKVLDKVKPLKGYLLGVCPSKVSVDFYSKFGFIKRPENPNGFMSLEIK